MRLKFHMKLGKVMRIKSMKTVFVARIMRHKSCMICAVFDFFVNKSFLTKNYFLTAELNLTTWGPLYTCLVLFTKLCFYTLLLTLFCCLEPIGKNGHSKYDSL